MALATEGDGFSNGKVVSWFYNYLGTIATCQLGQSQKTSVTLVHKTGLSNVVFLFMFCWPYFKGDLNGEIDSTVTVDTSTLPATRGTHPVPWVTA